MYPGGKSGGIDGPGNDITVPRGQQVAGGVQSEPGGGAVVRNLGHRVIQIVGTRIADGIRDRRGVGRLVD